MAHSGEVLSNLSPPLASLRQLVRSGELCTLLRGAVRQDDSAPARQRRLNPAGIDQLVAEYAAGLSVYVLANKHRVDRGVVTRHPKDRGVSVRPTLLQPEVDRILELYAEGHSPNRIGKLVKRDPQGDPHAPTSAWRASVNELIGGSIL